MRATLHPEWFLNRIQRQLSPVPVRRPSRPGPHLPTDMQLPSTGSRILASVAGKVLTITLNRPEKLNAVSMEVRLVLDRGSE